MDRFTDDTRFSDYTSDANEQKQGMDYSLENELRKTIQRQKKTIFSLAERNRIWKVISTVLAVVVVIESILLWTNTDDVSSGIPEVAPEQQSSVADTTTHVVTIHEFDVDEVKIDEIISQMSLSDKISQLMFVTPEQLTGFDNVTAAGDSTNTALQEYKVGGIIYSQSNFESGKQTIDMLKNTMEYSSTPLFLAVERDSGNIMPESSFVMPSQSVIGEYDDINLVVGDYIEGASELANLGINVNFAPGAELGGSLSFSSDADIAASAVSAAINGQLQSEVCGALKYFPTNTSSERSAEDLRNSEFKVYKAGIEAGADFVIVSNGINNSLDSRGVPCCMSSNVIGDLLRTELGFSGIVITAPLGELEYRDEFTPGHAAVECIKAGANMLMTPPDMEQVMSDITDAVNNGELDVSLIDKSLKRIFKVKMKRGIM